MTEGTQMFPAETKEAFSKYEETKLEISRLEEIIDGLKSTVLEAIPEGTEVKGASGTFSVQKRKLWKYTEAVDAKAKELKELKSEEEAKGIAEATESPTLMYRVKKEEE